MVRRRKRVLMVVEPCSAFGQESGTPRETPSLAARLCRPPRVSTRKGLDYQECESRLCCSGLRPDTKRRPGSRTRCVRDFSATDELVGDFNAGVSAIMPR